MTEKKMLVISNPTHAYENILSFKYRIGRFSVEETHQESTINSTVFHFINDKFLLNYL